MSGLLWPEVPAFAGRAAWGALVLQLGATPAHDRAKDSLARAAGMLGWGHVRTLFQT